MNIANNYFITYITWEYVSITTGARLMMILQNGKLGRYFWTSKYEF